MAGPAACQMLMVAVGWQMYGLTGSAWDLGLVGLYQFAVLWIRLFPGLARRDALRTSSAD